MTNELDGAPLDQVQGQNAAHLDLSEANP